MAIFDWMDKIVDAVLGKKEPDIKEYPIPDEVDLQDFALKRAMEEAAMVRGQLAREKRENQRLKEAGQVVQLKDLLEEMEREVAKRRIYTEKQREISWREIQDYLTVGKIVAFSKEGSNLGVLIDFVEGIDENSGNRYIKAVWRDATGKEFEAYAADMRHLIHYYDNITNQLRDGTIHLNYSITNQMVIPDYVKLDKITSDPKHFDEMIHDLNKQLSVTDEKKRDLEFAYDKANKRAENAEMQLASYKTLLQVNKATTQDLHNVLQDYAKSEQIHKREDVHLRESKIEYEEQIEILKEIVRSLQKELAASLNAGEQTKAMSLMRDMSDLIKDMGRKTEPAPSIEEPQPKRSSFNITQPPEQQVEG